MQTIQITAVIPVVDGVEEIEAVTTINLLRRARIKATVVAVGGKTEVTGRSQIRIAADQLIEDLDDDLFEVLILPGGPGVASLRQSHLVRDLVARHANKGRLIAAICAAPTVLLDAGLLENRRYTAHPSVARELPGLIEGEDVVVDGNVITSRGAGTAVPFALAIIKTLCPPDTDKEVALSICFPQD